MPTSDVAGSVIVLAASALTGIAIGVAMYALATSMKAQASAYAAAGATPRRRRRLAADGGSSGGMLHPLLTVLVPVSQAVPLPSVRATLAARYARAGWPGGLEDEDVYALAMFLGVVFAAVLSIAIAGFDLRYAPLGLVGLLVGPGLVSSWLNNRGAEREKQISRSMPFVLDLLVLTMRAGATLPAALDQVALDYSGSPVGVEFRSIIGDLEMGVTTSQSLETFASRVPIQEVKTFVDDLIQAQELGRPVAEALERLATRVRERRVQEATETAGKAKVMVLIPGMLIFVAALLLLFSPFIVRYLYGGYTSI